MTKTKPPSPTLLGSVNYLPLRTPFKRTPGDAGDLEGDPGDVEEYFILQEERDQAGMHANELAYEQRIYDAADKCEVDEKALQERGLTK